MDNHQKIVVPIKGMHCKSCEILIEDELSAVSGVKEVKADWRQSSVDIKYEGAQPDNKQITSAIERAGYQVAQPGENGKNNHPGFFSRDKKEYRDLGLAFLVLVGLYFILRGLGITNLSVNVTSDLTVPLILLIGLTAGFSTCMALVGGLILGISARYSERHPEATSAEKFYPHLVFNSGRVLAYAVLGGVLGLLGSAFQLSSSALGFITIAVGIIMIAMGLQLISIFPWAEKLKITLPKSLSRSLGLKERQAKGYSGNNTFWLGALTFFLPCGFTQAMQVYAISTGSFFGGAVVMGAFAVGTMPGLLSIGGLTSAVKGQFAKRFFKFAGLAIIAFAILNISNGWNLTGVSLAASQTDDAVTASDPNVTLENGFQIVRMAENSNGYSPNSFTIKKDIPVKWIITANAPYSCASAVVLSKYKIHKNLVAGENTIEFTPTEVGRLPFSCSMGMYTGVFNVIDENSQGAAGTNNVVKKAEAASQIAAPTASSGGGCGMAKGGGCGCGGGAKIKKDTVSTAAQVEGDVQIIKSTYTASDYLKPNSFKVKAGKKVRLMIDVKDNGTGCGAAIKIPELYDNPTLLVAGRPITLEFTPTTAGSYDITCSMEMIRLGTIVVE